MRPEMEDAVIAVPRLVKIPTKLLMNDQFSGVTSENLAHHQTAHFFGVYDGHGGCQVADYCRNRIHSALLECDVMIIPRATPETMIIPRAKEDECLILATDGLWDVMSNEEACEAALKRILIWHKKNGCNPVAERGKGVDPAAQAAAEYLSRLAMQRGSKDNISVIVVDFKPQRKFKSKPLV